MDHVHRRTRLRYQGQVRSQLEQTGDLGGSNPYGRCQEDATAKPKRSESNSRVPLWPLKWVGESLRVLADLPRL